MLKSVVLFSLWAYSFKKQNFAQGPSMSRMNYFSFHELCGGAVAPVQHRGLWRSPALLCWGIFGLSAPDGALGCWAWENSQLPSCPGHCSSDQPSTSIIHSTLVRMCQSVWQSVHVCPSVPHTENSVVAQRQRKAESKGLLVSFPIMAVVVATHSPALLVLGGICTRVCGFSRGRGAPGSKTSACVKEQHGELFICALVRGRCKGSNSCILRATLSPCDGQGRWEETATSQKQQTHEAELETALKLWT